MGAVLAENLIIDENMQDVAVTLHAPATRVHHCLTRLPDVMT